MSDEVSLKSEEKQRCLIIDRDTLFKIKIEKLGEFKTSFLYDVYYKAAKQLKTLLKQMDQCRDKSSNNGYFEDEVNNIISFVGERGSGKTSAMVSFKNSLESLKRLYEEVFPELCSEEHMNKDYKFKIMDVIDPSILREKDSIIDIVIAELFNQFKEFNKENDSTELLKKQNIVRAFESVYKDLKVLRKDKNRVLEDNVDYLEALVDLSAATSLKKHMYNLINKFLEYTNKHYLIISIDDIDMNISSGREMLEDIRRYLILPNVVILMAVKYNQLEEVVKQKNIEDLRILTEYNFKLKDTVEGKTIIEKHEVELNNKTKRYLEKMLPYSRRIIMPDINLTDTKLELNFKNLNENDNDTEKDSKTVEKRLVELLYKKLGIIVFTDEFKNLIIPTKLRSFIELIVFLDGKKEDNKVNNLSEFKSYVNFNIVDGIMNIKHKDIIENILNCEFSNINVNILKALNNELFLLITKAVLNDGVADRPIYKNVLEINENQIMINRENISLGDIITLFKTYELHISSDDDRYFFNVMKLIYTIRLLERYFKCISSEENNLNYEMFLSVVGIDFFGEYFKVKINRGYKELKKPCRTRELNKDKFLENLNTTDKINAENFALGKNYIKACIEPIYEGSTKQVETGRYYRIDSVYYKAIYAWEELNGFRKVFYKPSNLIGYEIMKGCIVEKIRLSINKHILSVINIDLFMDILEKLSIRLDNNRDQSVDLINKFQSELSKLFKEASEKNSKIEWFINDNSKIEIKLKDETEIKQETEVTIDVQKDKNSKKNYEEFTMIDWGEFIKRNILENKKVFLTEEEYNERAKEKKNQEELENKDIIIDYLEQTVKKAQNYLKSSIKKSVDSSKVLDYFEKVYLIKIDEACDKFNLGVSGKSLIRIFKNDIARNRSNIINNLIEKEAMVKAVNDDLERFKREIISRYRRKN